MLMPAWMHNAAQCRMRRGEKHVLPTCTERVLWLRRSMAPLAMLSADDSMPVPKRQCA